MTQVSTGGIESFRESMEENMKFLRENAEKLPEKDASFVRSLCTFYDTYDKLSERQLPYAVKFYYHLRNLSQVIPGDKSVSHALGVEVDTADILALFDKAYESGMKFPKLRYYDGATTIDIYKRVHGNPGWLVFRLSSGTYLAQISLGGQLIWTEHQDTELRKIVMRIIKEPFLTLQASGKRAKTCCFCGIGLTTKESLFAGYGPICADHWGLPWGEVPDVMESI